MMRFRQGWSIIILISVVAVLTWFGAAVGGEDQPTTSLQAGSVAAADTPDSWENIPAELVLKDANFKRERLGPVKFSHKKHNLEYKVRCAICHHFQVDDPNPVWKCGQCHDAQKKVGKIVRLMDAYHTDCRGCHQFAVEEGGAKNAPYRKCEECHEKKE